MADVVLLIFAIVLAMWGAFNYHKRRVIEDEIMDERLKKWREEFHKIRRHYRDTDIKRVVDESNAEWRDKLRRDDSRDE